MVDATQYSSSLSSDEKPGIYGEFVVIEGLRMLASIMPQPHSPTPTVGLWGC
jgi:hypothetical protein